MAKNDPVTQTTTPDPLTQDYKRSILDAGNRATGGRNTPTQADFGAWLKQNPGAMQGFSFGSPNVGKSMDTAYQQFLNQWNAGSGGGNPTALAPSPEAGQLAELLKQYTSLGGSSAAALGGDAAAIKKLMNPYESEVLASLDPFYQDAQDMALGAIDDQFTKAKAFGGSRQAVAQGQALGDIAKDKARTAADYRYRGFSDAMTTAKSGAQLGLAGGGLLSSVSDWLEMQRNPDLKGANIKKGLLSGLPTGQVTSQSVDQGSKAAQYAGLLAALLGAL